MSFSIVSFSVVPVLCCHLSETLAVKLRRNTELNRWSEWQDLRNMLKVNWHPNLIFPKYIPLNLRVKNWRTICVQNLQNLWVNIRCKLLLKLSSQLIAQIILLVADYCALTITCKITLFAPLRQAVSSLWNVSSVTHIGYVVVILRPPTLVHRRPIPIILSVYRVRLSVCMSATLCILAKQCKTGLWTVYIE